MLKYLRQLFANLTAPRAPAEIDYAGMKYGELCQLATEGDPLALERLEREFIVYRCADWLIDFYSDQDRPEKVKDLLSRVVTRLRVGESYGGGTSVESIILECVEIICEHGSPKEKLELLEMAVDDGHRGPFAIRGLRKQRRTLDAEFLSLIRDTVLNKKSTRNASGKDDLIQLIAGSPLPESTALLVECWRGGYSRAAIPLYDRGWKSEDADEQAKLALEAGYVQTLPGPVAISAIIKRLNNGWMFYKDREELVNELCKIAEWESAVLELVSSAQFTDGLAMALRRCDPTRAQAAIRQNLRRWRGYQFAHAVEVMGSGGGWPANEQEVVLNKLAIYLRKAQREDRQTAALQVGEAIKAAGASAIDLVCEYLPDNQPYDELGVGGADTWIELWWNVAALFGQRDDIPSYLAQRLPTYPLIANLLNPQFHWKRSLLSGTTELDIKWKLVDLLDRGGSGRGIVSFASLLQSVGVDTTFFSIGTPGAQKQAHDDTRDVEWNISAIVRLIEKYADQLSDDDVEFLTHVTHCQESETGGCELFRSHFSRLSFQPIRIRAEVIATERKKRVSGAIG